MSDLVNGPYAIFFIFGCIWIAMAVAAWVAALKSEGQPVRVSQWGLVVALPILIPLVLALIIAAIYH